MALQRKGLGRGLDALLDPYSPEEAEAPKNSVRLVNVRDIDTNKDQPRKQFDQEALSELSASIKVHGIVQPLIVREKDGRYMIIAGERRFRAARLAGLEQVPVLVADYDDEQIHEVSLIENIQREDLNPIEEAAAIRFLMKQHDMTQEEVSGRIGKSRSAVANSLRLLQLPEPVVELLKSGTLSAGHGRALAGLTQGKQMEQLAAETVRMGYSVRALESRVRNLTAGDKPAKEKKTARPAQTADLREAEGALREKLGTRVQIQGTADKGKLVIDYYTRDDLSRLYDLLSLCEKKQ